MQKKVLLALCQLWVPARLVRERRNSCATAFRWPRRQSLPSPRSAVFPKPLWREKREYPLDGVADKGDAINEVSSFLQGLPV